MSQTLNEKLSAAADMGLLKKSIPEHITGNLAPNIALRPYQVTTLERFLFFVDYQAPTSAHTTHRTPRVPIYELINNRSDTAPSHNFQIQLPRNTLR